MVFDLPVKGDKVKPQQITALHLFCGLAFMGTGAIIYVYNFEITYWGLALLVAGIALSLATIIRNRLVTATSLSLALRVAELLISLSIATLSIIEQWKFPIGIFSVLSAVIIFSVFWERSAGKQLYAHVDEGGIRMPATSRRRHIPWNEIDQVLLRYGTFSVDCLDNKLYQLDMAEKTEIDIETFDAFCSAMIAANVEKREKNNW